MNERAVQRTDLKSCSSSSCSTCLRERMHLIHTLKQGVSETRYLATRSDSSVKRCQPLVVFGVNPGSLRARRKKKKKKKRVISHKFPLSVFKKLKENEMENIW